ncbi:MAG: TadE/TadG family type IV pilus assembly protein [Gammaproteobacteria bacterium]
MRRPLNALRSARARGAVLVETVVVLPLLLALILGTAEFGHAFWQYSTLTKSVRDGARFAASQGVLGSTGVVVLTAQLTSDVSNVVVYGNVSGSGAPVLNGFTTSAVTLEAPGDGDIIVRAVYPYDALFGLVPTFYSAAASAPLNLTAAVRMRAI